MSNYIRKKSQKQEKRTAKDFGGKVTPASGALDGCKGDARTSSFLIENKFTDADVYKLELKTWEKIKREAIKDGLRIPIMQIDIQDIKLVLTDLYDMQEFLPEALPMFSFSTAAKSIQLHKYNFEVLLSRNSFHIIEFKGSAILGVTLLDYYKIFLDQN